MTAIVSKSMLEIGQVGGVEIRVPITTVGSGEPRLVILCGVHGDETGGVIISHNFLREILGRSLKGTVSIIVAANPLAQFTRTRVGFTDFYDLNRVGSGKPKGTLTERLAYRLCEHLSQSSFVVDLHEFKMSTPVMAIYVPSEDPDVDRSIVRGISAFGPSIVWSMNLSAPDEVQYSGSLLAVLIKRGVPGFAVETSDISLLSRQVIRRVVEGLIEIAKFMGIIEGNPRRSHPEIFVRNVVYSDKAGIWSPVANLLEEVQDGERIGELIALDLIGREEVVSPLKGKLIQLKKTAFVHTGDSLFAVGIEEREVMSKFRSI